ncbi:MAG: hypothetical protein V3V08_05880 [Nannocystaceae bacterium]
MPVNDESARGFYGADAGEHLSYLEYGSIDLSRQRKNVTGFLLHQDAYDFYYLSRYLRDIFVYRDVIADADASPKRLADAVTRTAHGSLPNLLLKYAALCTARELLPHGECLRLCETGSSVFGIIDELLATNAALGGLELRSYLERAHFVGHEISELMNRTTEAIHPNMAFSFATDARAKDFLARRLAYDVYYCMSVCFQYCLESAQELAAICQPAKLSVLNQLPVSLQASRPVVLATGKRGVNISLSEFIDGVAQLDLAFYFQHSQLKYYEAGEVLRATRASEAHSTLYLVGLVGRPLWVETFISHYARIHSQLEAGGVPLVSSLTKWMPISDLPNSFGSTSTESYI